MMRIDGKTKLAGVMGDPIEHTLSPVIHNTLAKARCEFDKGMPAVYTAFHVTADGLEAAVKGAFELGVQGMNVTVPHKQAVMQHLVRIDDMAKAIGAVNTLIREEDGYAGYNTDAEGFLRELDFYGVEVTGKNVVVLGAGGASRAVVFALCSKNPERVFLFNRTIEKARELAEAANIYYGQEYVKADTYDHLADIPCDGYIAIQCTSVGLEPKNDECVTFEDVFYEKAAVGVDIIYKPTETRFMQLLREKKKPAYNGLRMLLYQAIAAHEKFYDVKITRRDTEIAARALEEAAGIKKPIVLVGYMGSGKSTVARILSALYYTTVKDTDDYIEKEYNRSINDIFAESGEQAFRDMETEVLRMLLAKGDNMYILSCGGGMPLREENRKLLKTLGTVVYLKASPETIYKRVKGDNTRPLLAGENLMDKIEKMIAERGPVYEDAAGIVIVTDNKSPEHVAEEIRRLL